MAFIFAAILLFALLGLEDSVWADMAFETKLSFVSFNLVGDYRPDVHTIKLFYGVLTIGAMAKMVFEYYAFDFQNLFLSDKIVGVNAEFEFNTSFIGMFLVIYFLSYVFQYGQELQIQSDETL